MSWIRMEAQKGSYQGKQQYDGVCEELDDLADEVTNGYAECNGSRYVLAPGSGAICAEDGKVHFKLSDGSWSGTESG